MRYGHLAAAMDLFVPMVYRCFLRACSKIWKLIKTELLHRVDYWDYVQKISHFTARRRGGPMSYDIACCSIQKHIFSNKLFQTRLLSSFQTKCSNPCSTVFFEIICSICFRNTYLKTPLGFHISGSSRKSVNRIVHVYWSSAFRKRAARNYEGIDFTRQVKYNNRVLGAAREGGGSRKN